MLRINFRKKARKIFRKIEINIKIKIAEAIEKLKIGDIDNLNFKKLSGKKYSYRIRIKKWRMIFLIFFNKDQIEIIDIFIKKSKNDYKKRNKLLT